MTKRICSFPDCVAPHQARGYCRRHYIQQRRAGLLQPLRTRLTGPFEERFWARVDRSDGPDACHPWMGARTKQGYGMTGRDLGTCFAHRVAWILTYGPVPDGKHMDHFRCDNPPCCNPTHVRPVTPRENALRSDGPTARNRAKTHCKYGHLFDEANTYYTARGDRRCGHCRREREYVAARRKLGKVAGGGRWPRRESD